VIIYGRNAVQEALRARRRPVHEIWATDAAVEHEPWLRDAGVPVTSATTADLVHRTDSESHQGVCARTDGYPYASAHDLLSKPDPLIVALDEVQDPQNLGAICRTAEAVGATGLVIPERRATEITPAACKASAGAVEWLPVARVRNLADFLGEAQRAGAWCYGAAAVADAVDYLEPDWRGGVVLVLGAEGKGLRPRVAASCDQLVRLPLHGRLDSLNVSAAAAALLYGILQKRVDSGS
jgi:23S rRNA (guanosine2251-2'-O)-methyltransferase